MSNYNRITFKERVRIEAGIYAKKSFSHIAKEIGRSTSSVTREVKQNRIMVKTPYSYGTDCIYPPSCRKTGLCGDEYCSKRCWTCMEHDCTGYCDRCVTHTCKKTERAPFVCDSCSEKNKKTFKGYTQEDMTLIANHINSTTRPGLEYKSPYDLVETEEMKKLLEMLNMSPVAADEICLRPKLLSKE